MELLKELFILNEELGDKLNFDEWKQMILDKHPNAKFKNDKGLGIGYEPSIIASSNGSINADSSNFLGLYPVKPNLHDICIIVKADDDQDEHGCDGPAPSNITEGKMSEIDANINEIQTKLKRVDVKIGKPSTYSQKSHKGVEEFIVWPVTFHREADKLKWKRDRKQTRLQEYSDFVYIKKGSTEVKTGLPPKNGSIRTVTSGM